MFPSTIERAKGGYRWYAVITHGGQERTARFHLERQGFEVYLPMRAPIRATRHAGPSPLFPRYLFVSADFAQPKARAIFSTIGVHSVLRVGSGETAQPKAIPNAMIEGIQAREVDGLVILTPPPAKPTRDIKEGEAVKVKRGAHADLNAVFMEPIDAKRCVVLLSLLGRDSRVAVDWSSIR